ncbi:pilin [Brevibacterium aurantiacum]|uniref:pilin n=1 Tax=Brevibacterium aurantiacum TaxID=273384 RepID=UPI001D003675|nr:pilin [Brevibacterium aurantiacum]
MNPNKLTNIVAGEIPNPVEGVVPDFSIFGAEFTELWQKLLAGVWGIALVIAVLFLIVGIVAMGKNSDSNPHEYKKGRTQAMWAGISLGGLAALAVIVGAILALVS